jgi:hypothetical protein
MDAKSISSTVESTMSRISYGVAAGVLIVGTIVLVTYKMKPVLAVMQPNAGIVIEEIQRNIDVKALPATTVVGYL